MCEVDGTMASSTFEAIVGFLVSDREGPEGLSAEDRLVATIGCIAAVDARSPRLRAVFANACAAGAEPRKLESILLHAVAYLGVIRVQSAFDCLIEVLAERGVDQDLLVGYEVEPDRHTRERAGVRLYDKVRHGRAGASNERFAAISAEFYPRGMELSGLVLDNDLLSSREREIQTVSMLACLGSQPDQFQFHVDVALGLGVGREEIGAILMLVQAYAGIPRTVAAADLVLETLTSREESGSGGTAHVAESYVKPVS
jgi:alkylhydroperoxidase/carboxymuconolactone decarboxylase family protein YurZ